MSAPQIASRPATGKVQWPLILIEGDEKAGKTYRALQLTKSPRVGKSYVIDLGEGSADEYAPIGDYEVIVHDGTFTAVYEQVIAVRNFAKVQLDAGEKPVCLVIDSMSEEWGVLVDAITAKASRSEFNRKKLAEDPAYEFKVPNQMWNDANAKHKRLMALLKTFPGIVVMTSRGRWVAEIKNGKPVEGSKVWKVEGQKNLAFDASAWITMRRTEAPTLEGCRSLHIGVRPGVDRAIDLPEAWEEGGLDWFIFEGLRLDPANAETRDLYDMTDDGVELPEGVVRLNATEILPRVVAGWADVATLQGIYSEVVARGMHDAPVPGPDGFEVPLGILIADRARALVGVAAPTGAPTAAAAEPLPVPATPGTTRSPDVESRIAVIVADLTRATTLDECRAVWRESKDVRGEKIVDPVAGETTIGASILARQAVLAGVGAEPDHAERAAGESVAAGAGEGPDLWPSA